MKYEMLDKLLEEKRAVFENISDMIWEFAETRFQEKQSAGLQMETLRTEGFDIEEGIGRIETAFCAKFGSGHPVIGILGEYDALPGMSQKADVTEKMPEKEGAPGHGCGHHLLGTGGMEAAVAVKDYLMKNPMDGTVIYYGCPGEEGGAGKAFMVREGCFDACDICLAWHPYSANFSSISTLANARIFFDFHGVSAHAAAAPHLGRSALDAVELMNVGVNYLREHMIPEARVHYAVTNSGGEAPNVVPAYAQVLYSVRAPGTEELHKLIKRVSKVAEGAAMMTETKVEIRVVSAYSDVLQNKTLDQLVFSHIREIYPLKYTEEEMVCAEKFHKVGDPGDWKTYQGLAKQFYGEKGNAFFRGAMADTIFPPVPVKMGSTDVGDVSWTVPTAWFGSACYALGTPAHSWLAVAQGKSGIAKRGMEAAASVIARTTLDIMENPQIAKKAREDMEKAKNGFEYHSVIPAEVQAGAF